jgi:hypothetical protein
VAQFDAAKYRAEAESRFVRASGRFPLTAVGDVNTYALFAEHARDLLAPTGRAGIIVPTGIATDNTTKDFFADLVTKRSLVQLIGFENEAFIFPDVHHFTKFCALTVSGLERSFVSAKFVFFCRYFHQILDPTRNFVLSKADLELISPNSGNCPTFRTNADAELAKKVYWQNPVLFHERTNKNTWSIRFSTMLHMANDSSLFLTSSDENAFPLYEAKLFWHFDHSFSTYENAKEENLNVGTLPQISAAQKANPTIATLPRYWVSANEVISRIGNSGREKWLISFRDVTNPTNERTAIFL